MSRPATMIPPSMHDTQGANGWEWRMVWQLRKCAGEAAISAANAPDFVQRAFWQHREQLLDLTANRIAQELPPIDENTPEQQAMRAVTPGAPDRQGVKWTIDPSAASPESLNDS